MSIEAIEDALAELLETYAALREHYIHPVPEGAHDDHHRANLVLRTEANTYRNAAYLLRHHREESASIGLPSWKWDEWLAKEREVSARLAELTGGAP